MAVEIARGGRLRGGARKLPQRGDPPACRCGESLVGPGSRCPSCDTPIARATTTCRCSRGCCCAGRCRHCGAPISPRYPIVELLTAVAFAAVVAVRGFDADLLLELPFVACLIALAGIDLDHRLLPNKIVYPMAVWGVRRHGARR